ncbi:hypothetical protein C8R45DRAFT_368583 [Mycena sanguinolenta]|nr:hypothetical protein C8R45DRAFT_368583 [Mycena sanguinolenta]
MSSLSLITLNFLVYRRCLVNVVLWYPTTMCGVAMWVYFVLQDAGFEPLHQIQYFRTYFRAWFHVEFRPTGCHGILCSRISRRAVIKPQKQLRVGWYGCCSVNSSRCCSHVTLDPARLNSDTDSNSIPTDRELLIPSFGRKRLSITCAQTPSSS